jgi:hypothetical protein
MGSRAAAADCIIDFYTDVVMRTMDPGEGLRHA